MTTTTIISQWQEFWNSGGDICIYIIGGCVVLIFILWFFAKRLNHWREIEK